MEKIIPGLRGITLSVESATKVKPSAYLNQQKETRSKVADIANAEEERITQKQDRYERTKRLAIKEGFKFDSKWQLDFVNKEIEERRGLSYISSNYIEFLNLDVFEVFIDLTLNSKTNVFWNLLWRFPELTDVQQELFLQKLSAPHSNRHVLPEFIKMAWDPGIDEIIASITPYLPKFVASMEPKVKQRLADFVESQPNRKWKTETLAILKFSPEGPYGIKATPATSL